MDGILFISVIVVIMHTVWSSGPVKFNHNVALDKTQTLWLLNGFLENTNLEWMMARSEEWRVCESKGRKDRMVAFLKRRELESNPLPEHRKR